MWKVLWGREIFEFKFSSIKAKTFTASQLNGKIWIMLILFMEYQAIVDKTMVWLWYV